MYTQKNNNLSTIKQQMSNNTEQKATMQQVTTMIATSKNLLFPSHNHLLTTGADDPTLIISWAPTRVIIKVKGHQHQWLAGGYDL